MGSVSTKDRKAKLLDGNEIPVIGLGTYLSAPHEVTDAVVAAWKTGMRHFDCAQFYRNETEVGEALQILARDEPSFKREDIWITSKAWNSHHRPENVKKALDQTLKDLGTDYIDLYLIHWPVNFAAVDDTSSLTGVKLEPRDGNSMLLDRDLSLSHTWRAFIELKESGKVKSIGVSNFLPRHIQKLIDDTGVTPSVNQVEAHPYLGQQQLLDYCSPKGIHITAYMPFGGDPSRGGVQVLGNPLVTEIAQKHGKDAGQVLASWGIKRGFSVLSKSVKPARIASNFQVYDLDDESYEALASLGREKPTRFGGLPFQFDPAWPTNVFDTDEERAAELLEAF